MSVVIEIPTCNWKYPKVKGIHAYLHVETYIYIVQLVVTWGRVCKSSNNWSFFGWRFIQQFLIFFFFCHSVSTRKWLTVNSDQCHDKTEYTVLYFDAPSEGILSLIFLGLPMFIFNGLVGVLLPLLFMKWVKISVCSKRNLNLLERSWS